MDLSNPKTWTDGIGVVTTAPHIVVPLVVAALGLAYWFRGKLAQATIDGLNSQNQALKDHRELVRGEADKLAKELTSAKAESQSLQTQLAQAKVAQPLLDKAATVTATIKSSLEANTGVQYALNAESGRYDYQGGRSYLFPGVQDQANTPLALSESAKKIESTKKSE